MLNVKSSLRRYPVLYRALQKGWHGLRRVVETHILGTRLQELLWRTRHLYKGRDWASGYLTTINHPHRQQLIGVIASFAPFANVLEVGCNSGPNLILLSEKFPEVTLIGVDINREAINVGKKYLDGRGIKNVQLRVGRADHLSDISSQSVDVVITDAILLLVGPDKIRQVLGEIHRIARKGFVAHEYHSASPPPGNYDGGRWVYNYEELIASCFPSAKYQISKSTSSGGGWDQYGALIRVSL
jgi:SAM-dependent methyltransferase